MSKGKPLSIRDAMKEAQLPGVMGTGNIEMMPALGKDETEIDDNVKEETKEVMPRKVKKFKQIALP